MAVTNDVAPGRAHSPPKVYFPHAEAIFAVSLILVTTTTIWAVIFAVLKPYIEGLEVAGVPFFVWSPPLCAGLWALVSTVIMWLVATVFFSSHSGLFDIHWEFSIWLAVLLARNITSFEYNEARSFAILFVGLLYGIRLCYNQFTSSKLSHFLFETDWRYEQFRVALEKSVIPWPLWSLVLVYISQMLFVYLGCFPVWAAHNTKEPFGLWDLAGLVISLTGIVGEAVADYQLQTYRLKRQYDPNSVSLVLMEGLWSLSRHPNYFFENVVWVGLVFFAIPSGSIYAWFGFPFMITLFFAYSISAVEKRMTTAARGNPEKTAMLKRYRKRTSVFFPWFPATNKK